MTIPTTSYLSWIPILTVIPFLLGIGTWTFIQKIRRSLRFQTFLNVFGKVADNPDNLILSIPLWKVKSNLLGDPRFVKETFNIPKAEITQFYGPEDTVAFDDLAGCIEVSCLLCSFHPGPVTFLLDTHAPLEEIGANKTIFIVGSPIANLLARAVLQTKKGEHERTFNLEDASQVQTYLKYIDQEESEERGVGTIIWDVQDKRLYDSARDWEYSMILRIPNNTNNGFFYFIGGPHSSGTLAAATFLKDNWSMFKKANPTAGLLLRMRRDIRETGKYAAAAQVEKRYGFPTS